MRLLKKKTTFLVASVVITCIVGIYWLQTSSLYIAHLATQYVPLLGASSLKYARLDREMNALPSKNAIIEDWSELPTRVPDENEQPIPKIIWTYWNGRTVPKFIQKCLDSWRDTNPDYKINLISSRNVHSFVPKDVSLPRRFHLFVPYLQADWIRLTILRHQGGIWLDASTILTGSLDFVHEKRNHTEGFLYYLGGFSRRLPKFPIIENWFLSAVPHSDFISKWQTEFDFVVRHFESNGLLYIEHLKQVYGEEVTNELLQGIPDTLQDYLKCHIAAQKVMQLEGVRPMATMEACEGPLKIINEAGWKSIPFVKALNMPIEGKPPTIIKLRSQERMTLEWFLTFMNVHPDSIIAKYLKYS